MKKLGILSIIAGAILAILGIFGIVTLMASGVSADTLAQSLQFANAWGMTRSMSSGERFAIWVAQHRILLLILGVVLIIAGVRLVRQNGRFSGGESIGRIADIGIGAAGLVRSAASRLGSRGSIGGEEWEEVQENDLWEDYDPYDHPEAVSRSSQTSAYVPQTRSTTRTVPAPRARPAKLNPNRCCICGGNLDQGHAVIVKTSAGEEGRIDEKCYQMIDILAVSEDRYQLRRAIAYMDSYLDAVEPIVARKINEYIRSARDYMNR